MLEEKTNLVENPVGDPERSRGEQSRRAEKSETVKPSGELLVTLMTITPNAEQVIEMACRTCYLSFHRYNPPASTDELIKKILRKGHHSVLEHAHATFRIKGGSRVFTHELIRHRLISPSQESQRYVQYGKTRPYDYVLPPSVEKTPFAERYMELASETQAFYEEMVKGGVPKEDARYILPNATTSEIVISANFREFRHLCSVRCTPFAHWEIRKVCFEMLKILKKEAPITFYDFVLNEENNTVTILPPEELKAEGQS